MDVEKAKELCRGRVAEWASLTHLRVVENGVISPAQPAILHYRFATTVGAGKIYGLQFAMSVLEMKMIRESELMAALGLRWRAMMKSLWEAVSAEQECRAGG